MPTHEQPKYRIDHRYNGSVDIAELESDERLIAFLADLHRIGVDTVKLTTLYCASVEDETSTDGE